MRKQGYTTKQYMEVIKTNKMSYRELACRTATFLGFKTTPKHLFKIAQQVVAVN